MKKPPTAAALLFLITAILTLAVSAGAAAKDLDVPYVASPDKVVDLMMDQADIGLGDYVIDLGTGDGRIAIAAVKKGATGLGVDLDPQLIRKARTKAKAAGVSDRLVFRVQDLFATDIRRASVVTIFLNEKVNLKLRDTLLRELEPGTRVVSHNFDMGDWHPDKHQGILVNNGPNYYMHDVYTWIIPARLEGHWQWQAAGRHFSMTVTQKYQDIDARLEAGNSALKVQEAYLSGRRINISALEEGTGNAYTFIGNVAGGNISGEARIESDGRISVEDWSAAGD